MTPVFRAKFITKRVQMVAPRDQDHTSGLLEQFRFTRLGNFGTDYSYSGLLLQWSLAYGNNNLKIMGPNLNGL
jgi:hypothetical protein